MSNKYKMGEYPYCVCAFPKRTAKMHRDKTYTLTEKDVFQNKLREAVKLPGKVIGEPFCSNDWCQKPFDPNSDK